MSDQPGNDRKSGESGQPVRSGQSGRSGGSGQPGRSGGSGQSGRSGQSGSDLIGEMQRWLIRSSAKNMRRELGGQVRRKLGGDRSEPQDVWDTATSEPPGYVGDAPECAWCPVCRAARRIRESGPGLGSQLSGAGDAVAAAVQEALSAFDGVLSRTGPGPERARRAPDAGGSGAAAAASAAAAGESSPDAASWSAATDEDSAGSDAEGPEHEPDDRR